jgi:hypothetical protein
MVSTASVISPGSKPRPVIWPMEAFSSPEPPSEIW